MFEIAQISAAPRAGDFLHIDNGHGTATIDVVVGHEVGPQPIAGDQLNVNNIHLAVATYILHLADRGQGGGDQLHVHDVHDGIAVHVKIRNVVRSVPVAGHQENVQN